jgi:hypothetical protein
MKIKIANRYGVVPHSVLMHPLCLCGQNDCSHTYRASLMTGTSLQIVLCEIVGMAETQSGSDCVSLRRFDFCKEAKKKIVLADGLWSTLSQTLRAMSKRYQSIHP